MKRPVTGAVAVLFLSSGTLHFLRTAAFVKIVPPYLPQPTLLVYVSGASELAGALGLLIPKYRRLAAWSLAALLVSVFPANIYMATNFVQVTQHPLPQWVLWARLPLQAVLIAAVLWCTIPDTD